MIYELEFLGLNQETKDADAACFRYYNNLQQRPIVGIYDGGLKVHGKALREHLNKYYFDNTPDPIIDYVICSHSDQDHASGLTEILENFRVKTLIMNRPWMYVNELFPSLSDKRITKASLKKRLRENYPYICELESLANKKGTIIQDGFQGTRIGNHLTILSPSREFYLQCIVESSKTPFKGKDGTLSSSIIDSIAKTFESWTNELIRENVKTSPENESSIIVLGDMGEEKFLLTGDSGIQALTAAADYAEKNICSLTKVNVQQIPHHGGRHNVSPSVLNRILGSIVPSNTIPTRTAIVSVGLGSDHPRKMVTNAYIRRGFNVYEARDKTLLHYYGNISNREGWGPANPSKFSQQVEEWND